MKEITKKDLGGYLGKARTKAQLIRLICHIANIANEYTRPGDGLVGDRALSKLNLTKPRFKIRRKPVPEDIQELAVKVLEAQANPKAKAKKKWEPRPGDTVKIIKSSVYYAQDKVGEIESIVKDGFHVKILYKDTFCGETEPYEHVIFADVIEPYTLPPAEANPS
jgi:hypothetical protein